jgi:hypothetical protein
MELLANAQPKKNLPLRDTKGHERNALLFILIRVPSCPFVGKILLPCVRPV